jgi:hypothetical protein
MSVELSFDVTKIKWQKRSNEKGEFEVSTDVNSLDHKALLKFLNEYGGLASDGWYYWVYRNGWMVGRRKSNRARRRR